MDVKILSEGGIHEALLGISLSYQQKFDFDHFYRVALNLSNKDGGHNKFLESMIVWLDINAPRFWWSQFDTYRVGTTKQSESTMHTLSRTDSFTSAQFEPGTPWISIVLMNVLLKAVKAGDCTLDTFKAALPEGFLQRRIITTNYKVLKNMVVQRGSHKLPQWQEFVLSLRNNLNYPEFIFDDLRELRKDTIKKNGPA
jgi:hypothetical protein